MSDQKFNAGHIIEGCDRLHILCEMIENLLEKHPAILEAGVENDIGTAASILAACYQKVGALDEEGNE